MDGFHASWYGQSGYPTLCPGERSTAVVAYYNSGSRGWVAGRLGEMAFLGTWNPVPGQDQPSVLGGDGTLGSPATGWPRYNRVAAQPADYVGPNQVSWFQFTIQAPAAAGTYRLYIRPLVEGATWMEDFGVFWQVTVQEGTSVPPPAPTPTPLPPAGIDVAPTARATLATGGTRSYTATLGDPNSCVDLALVDARSPRADGSFRDVERDTGYVVGNDRADLSKDALFTIVNGTAVSSSFIECVRSVGGVPITFSVSSSVVNAFVRPIVFRDLNKPPNQQLDLDPLDRPAEPVGVGGAIRFLPASAPAATQQITVQTVTVEERLFTDAGQLFRWDDNDVFRAPSAALTLAQFEQMISVNDTVTVRYNPDPAGVSQFDITSDAGRAAPALLTNVGSYDGGTVQDDVRLTITELPTNSDDVPYTISRATVSGSLATCTSGSGTYALVATVTVPLDQDITTYDDRDLAPGRYCYLVAATSPVGGSLPGTFSGIVLINTPPTLAGAPISLDARVVTFAGNISNFDAGDVVKIAFSSPLRAPADGAMIRARDSDGTNADFVCGSNTTCQLNDATETVGGLTYGPGSVLTLTLTAPPTVAGEGSTVGLQIAATVIFSRLIVDTSSREWNIPASADLLIGYTPPR